VPQFDNLLGLLGSRSFSSIWFWLVLIGTWSMVGRSVLGVPTEVLSRAHQAQGQGDGQGTAVITLLDWLSLILPRWQLGAREGAVFLGVTSFLITSLAVLGFGFGLEMAQALTLLLVPFWALFWMRVRLARRLVPLVHAAQEGRAPDDLAQAFRHHPVDDIGRRDGAVGGAVDGPASVGLLARLTSPSRALGQPSCPNS